MADTPARLPIIFCPVCCSPADAPSYGTVEMTCEVCLTAYRVILDIQTVAEHSIH